MGSKKNITVFISSSMKELEYDREIIDETLQVMNMDSVLFEIFPAFSQSAREAYLTELNDCDIFIMVLWKVLTEPVIEEYREAIKKNKPILILIKTLVDNENRDDNMKQFIDELSAGPYKNIVYKNYRKISDLKQVVRNSVSAEIAKLYVEPKVTLSRPEMYELGTQIIHLSQERVCIFQKTPSLLLGARDYLSDERTKLSYEKDFVDALEMWIEKNYRFGNKEFLYMFSLEATKKEIEAFKLESNDIYMEMLKEKIKMYQKIESDTGYKFRFCPTIAPTSGPLIVGDAYYAMWLIGTDDAVAFSQRNVKIGDIIVRMLKTRSQEKLSMSEIL